jgi:surfeit locus 1 family protein
MPAGYSFRPRIWAFLLAAAACAAFVALGNWQASRAEHKQTLAMQRERALVSPAVEVGSVPLEPSAVVLRRVAARGQWIGEHTVFLDNKLRGSRPGYEVVTPMRLNGMHVLVNRGWVAAGRTRDVLPDVPTPAGTVRVEGLALERLPRPLVLGGGPAGTVRQHIDVREFGKEIGLQFQPIVIEQHSAAPDGLARDWPRADAGVEKHQAYSLQWYSFAALAAILFFALSFRRVRAS